MKEIEKLRIVFLALKEVRKQLGEKMYKEIRMRLASGEMTRQEIEYANVRRSKCLP